MAEINEKTARIMTIAGVVDSLIAVGIIIFILAGKSSLPIFIPLLLLVTGILLVVLSLAYYTKK